jgi:hypothetical protein
MSIESIVVVENELYMNLFKIVIKQIYELFQIKKGEIPDFMVGKGIRNSYRLTLNNVFFRMFKISYVEL